MKENKNVWMLFRHKEAAALLIDKGADVNIAISNTSEYHVRTMLPPYPRACGSWSHLTTLGCALSLNMLEVAKRIVERGGEVYPPLSDANMKRFGKLLGYE